MTLRIDVNVPPRLIERAREQQVERRLAKAAEQRQALVRKEAARQVALQRLATGKDAQGNDVRGGALEDQRRRWFGAQTMTKNYQLGVVRVKLVYLLEYAEYSIHTRSGSLIAAGTPYGVDIALLPVAGYVFILVVKEIVDRGEDGWRYSAYVCSDNASRVVSTPDWAESIFLTMQDSRVEHVTWGLQSQNALRTRGGVFTAGIYYAIRDMPRGEWGLVPDAAIVYSSSPPTNNPLAERTIYPHYTKQYSEYGGLPYSLYLNPDESFDDFRIPEAEYLSQSSDYWKGINARPLNGMRDGLAEGRLLPFAPGSELLIRTDNVVLCWDWGRPDFCREQLLSLGFSPEDLIP